ncbi:MAG TPA: hypothetical protein DCX06_10370 [Opitutae bacterium]|nr:hypothetical protein [Opitutae bacterium]
MPSFTFYSSKDNPHLSELVSKSTDCVVPSMFEGVRGNLKNKCSYLNWHSGHQAPVEHYQSSDGSYAFLIGDAIADTSDDYLSAEELLTMVTEQREQAEAGLIRHSGFYAWIVVLADDCIYCGSDPFGFFPIYYFQGKDSLCISTSLNALHAHPEYDASVDPVGFCRYIMENGCSSDRTLEKSGKRLQISRTIRYDLRSGKLTTTQFPYPGSLAEKRIHTLEAGIKLAAEASIKAVKRHTQRGIDSCMLSGGLDSRQLLGIAHQLGHRPVCVTTGTKHTYESINARRVARNLGLKWECSMNKTEPGQKLLDDEMYLTSLGGGFNNTPMSWAEIPSIRGSRYLTGLFFDVLMYPMDSVGIEEGFCNFSFAQNSWIHNFGVIPEILEDLLVNDTFITGFHQAIEEVRAEWEALPSDPIRRQWQTVARYRARAHHGYISWKNAFYNWPIIPAMDVPLHEAIHSIAYELMLDRKLQNETFMATSPDLAKIPLVSVSSKPRPLITTRKTRYYRKMERLERRYERLKQKCSNGNSKTNTARTHCWELARQQAIEQVDGASDIFDTEKVLKLIHASQENQQCNKRNYRQKYSDRLLAGAIYWLVNRPV